MEIKRISKGNFTMDSLRDFQRHQVVKNIYKQKDGQLILVPASFSEDWSQERRKEKAKEILGGRFIVFGAFDDEKIVGEIMLVPELDRGRMIVDSFHVSEEHRRKGIGSALFKTAESEAKKHGAKALYISASSAQETIDFYLAMGCKISHAPITERVEAEPFDIQMECML